MAVVEEEETTGETATGALEGNEAGGEEVVNESDAEAEPGGEYPCSRKRFTRSIQRKNNRENHELNISSRSEPPTTKGIQKLTLLKFTKKERSLHLSTDKLTALYGLIL